MKARVDWYSGKLTIFANLSPEKQRGEASLDFYVGNTDLTWYRNLRNLHETPEDINFWRPSRMEFKAIPVGTPFLLRLKSLIQMIGGMGTFMGYERVLLREAWELFGEGNGYYQFAPFKDAIQS